MAIYCIVAARPKGASNHINSKFKLCERDAESEKWKRVGWKPIDYVADLMQDGHRVMTGKLENKTIYAGAAVELELRIVRNRSHYKISEMPDT